MKKNYSLKIPKEISIFYYDKNSIILIKGPLGQKVLKLKNKLEFEKGTSLLCIKNSSFLINLPKNKKSLQGTTLSLIKQKIFEVSKKVFIKLKLNGIGYKINIIDKKFYKLLRLKLGLSHFIYYKIPNIVEMKCYSTNKLIILGNNYNLVTSIASKIRAFKVPEVYKGKGILYENEIIKLKEGKKV